MYSFFQKWNIKELRWALLYYSNLFTNIACLDGIGCENTWETECLSLTHNNDWEEEHEEKSLSVTLARVRNLHLEKRSNRIHRYVIKVLFQSSILLHRLQEKNLSFLIFMFFYLKNYLREFVRLGESCICHPRVGEDLPPSITRFPSAREWQNFIVLLSVIDLYRNDIKEFYHFISRITRLISS